MHSHISAIAETGQECMFVVNGRKRISASLAKTVLWSSGHFGPVNRGPVQWLDGSFTAKTGWASPWEGIPVGGPVREGVRPSLRIYSEGQGP